MTERVIDSSILAAYLLREEGWERLEDTVFQRPYTLPLAVKETLNALWKRVRLLGDIDQASARTILGNLLELSRTVLRVEPQEHYLARALDIALEHNIPIYDALFIAQAEGRKAQLVSRDRIQLEVAKLVGVPTLLL